MIDDKAKNAYKSITAPDSLRDRVFASDEPALPQKQKASIRLLKPVLALCACICTVFIATAIFASSNKTVSLYYNDQKIGYSAVTVASPEKIRTSTTMGEDDFSVILNIQSEGEYEVNVSLGTICDKDGKPLSNPVKLSGQAQIIWRTALTETSEQTYNAVLTVAEEKKESLYILSADDISGVRTIKKYK